MQPTPQDHPRELPALFHIADETQWQRAQADGEVRPASLTDEGFVHCSFAEQLGATLRRHFAGQDGLLVLTVDPALLGVPIRVEDSYGTGQAFPHVYGPIPVGAITAVTPAPELIATLADRPAAPGRASVDR